MPGGSWQQDAAQIGKAGVSLERVGQRSREAVRGHRVEARLPPYLQHPERPCAPVDARLDPPDESVAEEHRQDVIAPPSFRRRDVHLPDIVEVVQRAQEGAIPDERIQWRQEGDRRVAGRNGARRDNRIQDVPFLGEQEPFAAYPLHDDRDQRAILDESLQQFATGRRSRSIRRASRRSGPVPQLGTPRASEEAVRPVARQELVATLLALGSPLGEQRRGEEALDEVVHPPVPVAPGETQDPCLGECLQDGPHLVGGPPVPVDRRPRLQVRRRQRAVPPDPVEQLLHEGGVYVERGTGVLVAVQVPGDAVPGQLPGRHDGQALVVGLVQHPRPVEMLVRPGTAVAGDPCRQHEVVVPAGHRQRVELERAEPFHDAQNGSRVGRQSAWRREEVAGDQEAARGRPVKLESRRHRPMVRDGRAVDPGRQRPRSQCPRWILQCAREGRPGLPGVSSRSTQTRTKEESDA